MKILFLDIDGVLNTEKTLQRSTEGFIGIDPHKAFMIGKIVLDTGCNVVLSSMWRLSESGRDEVKSRVIDFIDTTIAPHGIDGRWSTRGEEIQRWLDDHKDLNVEKYAIIDDDMNILPHQQDNFFKTSFFGDGLNEEIMNKIIEHLK